MNTNHNPEKEQHKESQSENDMSTKYWEYKVIHIKNVASSQPSTPESDSIKLQGVLSPEFIKREFPKMYQHKKQRPKHPAEQLELFLNSLGNERWELVETSQVGELLMFFFKRLMLTKSEVRQNLTN